MSRQWTSKPEFAAGDLPADPERALEVRDMLEELKEAEALLSLKQGDFLDEQRDKLAKQGVAYELSDRQYGWIKGLWEKYCEGNGTGYRRGRRVGGRR